MARLKLGLAPIMIAWMISNPAAGMDKTSFDCQTLFSDSTFEIHLPDEGTQTREVTLDTIPPVTPEIHELPERILTENEMSTLIHLNRQSQRIRAIWPHVHILDTLIYYKKNGKLTPALREVLKADLEKHDDLMTRDFGPDWREHFEL